MKVVSGIAELRAARAELPHPIGLAPTMGYLHAGHLSLVEAAYEQCASVIVTIFVNPTQFGPNEDFTSYPRDTERDLKLLEPYADLVFIPATETIYPAGFASFVDIGPIAERLEGAARPGHFRGVATVVAKLFNLTQPDRAYFGQKDAQQVLVIKQMTGDLDFSLEIVVRPTVREPDGLALSSRNVYLNPDERRSATALSRALFAIRDRWRAGEKGCRPLIALGHEIIAREQSVRMEYLSIADIATLRELERIENAALVSLAARVGKTRLIDNVLLDGSGRETF